MYTDVDSSEPVNKNIHVVRHQKRAMSYLSIWATCQGPMSQLQLKDAYNSYQHLYKMFTYVHSTKLFNFSIYTQSFVMNFTVFNFRLLNQSFFQGSMPSYPPRIFAHSEVHLSLDSYVTVESINFIV